MRIPVRGRSSTSTYPRDRRNWALVIGFALIIVACWFIADSFALRYLVGLHLQDLTQWLGTYDTPKVLFIGVMSCMYVLWDIVDDTIARKVNSSDAAQFSHICGCFPSQGASRLVPKSWLRC